MPRAGDTRAHPRSPGRAQRPAGSRRRPRSRRCARPARARGRAPRRRGIAARHDAPPRERRGSRAGGSREARSSLLRSSLDRGRDRERVDMGRDVVHAKQRSPPIERRHRRADRCRVAPDAAVGIAEHARERALARDADENRRPDGADSIEPAEQREVLRDGLAEADSRDRGTLDPRGCRQRRRPQSRSSRNAQTSPTTSSYRGATCIVRGCPCMCMRQTYAPASEMTPARAGSPRSAVTSLTSRAPSASARRATSALDVSIETGRPTSPSRTGIDAPQLLVERDGVRSGTGRLSPDVHERRTLVEQPPRRLRSRRRGRRCPRRQRSCRA